MWRTIACILEILRAMVELGLQLVQMGSSCRISCRQWLHQLRSRQRLSRQRRLCWRRPRVWHHVSTVPVGKAITKRTRFRLPAMLRCMPWPPSLLCPRRCSHLLRCFGPSIVQGWWLQGDPSLLECCHVASAHILHCGTFLLPSLAA